MGSCQFCATSCSDSNQDSKNISIGQDIQGKELQYQDDPKVHMKENLFSQPEYIQKSQKSDVSDNLDGSIVIKSKFKNQDDQNGNISLTGPIDLTKPVTLNLNFMINSNSQTKKSIQNSKGFDDKLNSIFGVANREAESEKNIEIFDQNLVEQLKFDSLDNQNRMIVVAENRQQQSFQKKSSQSHSKQRTQSQQNIQKQNDDKFTDQRIIEEMDQLMKGESESYKKNNKHEPNDTFAEIFKGPPAFKQLQKALKVLEKLPIFEVGQIPVDGVTSINYFKIKESGNIYIGQWKDGKMTGHGKMYYPSGGIYEGNFFNNIISGEGRMVFPNGDYYQGGFKEGKLDKQGEYKYYNGDSYTGEFQDGLRHGKGIFRKYKDILVYKGQYCKDLRQGDGIQTLKDIYSYTGQFYDDKANGQGKCTWGNIKNYVGTWKDDKMSGKGRLVWNDGKSYEGEFIDDLFHGKGQFNFQNGDVYIGQYIKGLKNGQGTMMEQSTNQKYEVEFKEDDLVKKIQI